MRLAGCLSRRYLLGVCFLAALIAAPSPGQPLTLVRDLRTTPNPVFVSPASAVVAGSRVFFVASYPGTGAELWVSDGTTAGTRLVKDVRPGLESSNPVNLTAFGADVLFQADDGSNGGELWKSDGTESGTAMVRDISPGPHGSLPGPFAVTNGVAYFAAYGPAPGGAFRELWRSDGTEAGTWLVKDVDPAAGSSNPANLAWVGGSLHFAATDAANGQELWRSDGTASGTVLVKDLRSGASGSAPRSFVEAGGIVYFTANDGTSGEELWRTDGTPAGTVLVKDVFPGSSGSSPQNLKGVAGTLFFSANDGTNGQELWSSIGTSAGTTLVEEICAGCSSSPGSLVESGGLLYFTAFDGASGRELWKSDGSAGGTERVSEVCAGTMNGVLGPLTPFAGKVYFQAGGCTAAGAELWASDGSTAGTAAVTDICAGSCSSAPSPIVATATKLFFGAADATHGRQLWISDGSAAGTSMVTAVELPWSFPGSFAELGSTLLFVAADPVSNARTLWKTDGTEPGTVQVAASTVSYPGAPVVLDGRAYFSGDLGGGNYELFATDGTDAGTVLVKDIQAGGVASNPAQLTVSGGKLYFVANDGVNGSELWVSDGTGAGTTLVEDIWPGSGTSSIQRITAVGGRIFFAANDGTSGLELWVSDGTAAGTNLVKDLLPGNGNANPQYLVDVGGTLWFTANDGTGTWIHRSDGTAAGTSIVTSSVNGPTDLTNAAGTVFFVANWNGDVELWRSDGTTPGTVPVADVNPAGSSMPTNLTAHGSLLYFRANDGTSGAELWRTDGTAERTWRVADVRPGPASSLPRSLTPAGSALYFVASDGVHGEELWKTDGTAAGTFRVQDLNPGTASANINPILRTSRGLFLTADDGTTGLELHLLDSAGLSVTKSASSPDPLQGSVLTFTITVSNSGPGTATLVRLLDPIPEGLTFVSTSPAGVPCVLASGMLSCDLGNLAPGASATVEVHATVDYGFTGTIANTARVAACQADDGPADDTATAVVAVAGPAAPSRLDAQPTSATSVALTWTPPVSTQTGIRIDRSTDGVAFAPVTTVGAIAAAHVDSGLDPGTLYWYRVVSIQAGVGESAPSNTAVARTHPAAAAKVCPAPVSSHHTWNRFPAAAWDGTRWAVALQVRDAAKELDEIHLRFLDAAAAQPTGAPLNASDDDMASQFPTLRWNGSRYGLVWYTSMRTPAGDPANTVCFALYDSAGLRLRVNRRVVDPVLVAINSNIETALGWNGSEWGLVLPIGDGTQNDLYFVRISAAGDRLGDPVRLTNTPESETDASLAWNGTAWGLSWIQQSTPRRLRFQRIQPDGAPIGAPTLVRESATGYSLQTTSIVPDGGGWAIAWDDIGPGPSYPEWIYLAKIAADGSLSGLPVRVSEEFDPAFPPGDQVPSYDSWPQLMNGPGGGFVVFTSAWLNTTDVREIGRYVTDAAGTRIGSRMILSADDGQHSANLRVAFDGTNYLVVYNDGSTGTQEAARLVSGASGGAVLPATIVTGGGSPGDSFGTATAGTPVALPVGDGFVVAFTEPTATGENVPSASFVDGAGSITARSVTLSSRAALAKPGGAAVGSAFALAWKEPDNDVWLGLYDAGGGPAPGEVLVASGQGGRSFVSAAFSGEAWGVAWTRGNNIVFRRVSPGGLLLGSQADVPLASQPANLPVQLAWTGSGWALAWIRGTLLEYTLLDATGNVSTGPVAVSSSSNGKSALAAAWNGRRLGIAWVESFGSAAPRNDILFTTVALNGVPDFVPVTAATSDWNEGNPSLYWAGDRFGLVHTWGVNPVLREVGVFPDGSLAPGARLLGPRGSANAVAWNGATLGVAWSQLGEAWFETTACLDDATPPGCPAVSAARNGRATTVSFTPPTDAESGIYRTYVYRDGALVADAVATTSSVLDPDSAPGVTHAYEVRPQNGAYLTPAACAPVSPAADLSVSKTDGSTTEVPGTSVSYALTVTNAGPSSVSGVMLFDAVPAVLQGAVFTPAIGTYDSLTGAWSGLTLGAGQSVSMTLSATVAASARGTLVNTASVASTAGTVDPNPANDSSADADSLVPSADLAVTITDSPDPVSQGAALTYVAGVLNAGPSSVAGVSLAVALPPGVTFVSSSPAGPACIHASGIVTCGLAGLAQGASAAVTVRVTPNAGTVGTIAATATASAVEGDPDGANNSATTQTTVSGPAPPRDLFVTARSASTVSLKWTDPQGGESYFRIDRSVDGTFFAGIDIVDANATTYIDAGRSPATAYYYRIAAVDTLVGESWSNLAAATTLAATAGTVCASRMGPDGAGASGPLPAWGGSSWTIAWTDRRDGLLEEVWLQRIASDGSAALGDPVRVTSTGASSYARGLAWNGSRYGLLWQESMKAPDGTNVSEFRLTAFDGDGNRLQGDVSSFRIEGGSTWELPSAPLLPNGSGWGVFLARAATAPSDVRYYRLDLEGRAVGPPTAITTTPDWEVAVSAAWSGTEYGVAWVRKGVFGGGYRVYFQRVALDGAPQGSPALLWENTTVSTTWWLHGSTSVAWDGASWVVAFTDIGPDPEQAEAIWLRRVDAAGLPSGVAVRLSPDYDPTSPPEDQVPVVDRAPVLFMKPGGGFVVLTSSFVPSGTGGWVEACRYEANALLGRVGTRIQISTGDSRSSSPTRAATDGSRVLVAWNEGRSGTPEIAAALVDVAGSVVAGPDDVTVGHAGGSSGNPVAIALGSGFGTLYTSTAFPGAPTTISGQFWNGAGTLDATRASMTDRGVRGAPAAVALGSTFALAWKDAAGYVLFRRFDETGAPLIPESQVGPPSGGRTNVGLAFSGDAWGLAYWSGSVLYFQRVGPDGSNVGSRVTVTTTAASGAPGPQVQWVGTGWALVWLQSDNLYYSRLDPAGAVVVAPIQITFTPQTEAAYQLHFTGVHLGLAWHEYAYPDPPGGEVYFTVLSLSGVKAFAPVALGSSDLDDAYPSFYWDADRFRVVMMPGNPGLLREVAVLPDGSVVPGERTLASRGGVSSVAWNGATLGVAWRAGGYVWFETTACLADATPPTCPATTVVFEGTRTTVSWTAASDPESGVQGYSVFRDGLRVAEEPGTAAAWVDTAPTPGLAHAYVVRARSPALLESAGCPAVSPSSDLSVGLADAPDPVTPAGSLTYTVTVSSTGPSAASGVALSVSLSPGAAFLASTPGAPACTHDSGTVTCALGVLPAGGSAAVTIQASAVGAGPLETSATVDAIEGDPVPSNNSASATTAVCPAAPVVTAPATVAPEQTFTASVPAVAGVTYAWSVTNGTLVAGDGTREVTVRAGPAGPVGISVVEQAAGTGCTSTGTASVAVALPATRLHPVAPCRLFDTRLDAGSSAAAPALAAGETRTLAVGSRCGLDSTVIRALSVNVTSTQSAAAGELVLWRADIAIVPVTSSISFGAGKTRANNAMLELSRAGDGTIKVHNRSAGSVHFILDVNGYFR